MRSWYGGLRDYEVKNFVVAEEVKILLQENPALAFSKAEAHCHKCPRNWRGRSCSGCSFQAVYDKAFDAVNGT